MNDFTKEELEEIHRCLKYMVKGNHTPFSCLTMELKKKTHRRMQNYCDHDWHNSYCGCVLKNFDCNKCGVILNDNQ